MREAARKAIKEHPFSSIFSSQFLDSEGKVLHQSAASNFGDAENESAIEARIARDSQSLRGLAVSGVIDICRRSIWEHEGLSVSRLMTLFSQSWIVPEEHCYSISRGFYSFFAGDLVEAAHILIPRFETIFRHSLRLNGIDVSIFDDASGTQKERTISILYELHRKDLYKILSESIVYNAEIVLLKQPGPALRNRIAHGLLSDGATFNADVVYACWLLFRLIMMPLLASPDEIFFPE